MAGEALADSRTGRNSRHSLTAQFRQSVFGRIAGYEDVNDADQLGADPAMRWLVGGQAVMGQAGSTSQMGRFETEVLAKEANVTALADLARGADRVVAFYNQRGTAEPFIKEGKNAVKWTRLSCHTMKGNAVRLPLHALADNLATFLRTLALPQEVQHWSLTVSATNS